MQSSADEWARNYQVNIVPQVTNDEPLDVTHMAASPTSDTTLSPKGSIGKPTRRRSRASKKVPMTLLNANARNFRALVQRFTGYHSAPPTFGNYRGPINLNFGQYNCSSSSEKFEGHQARQEHDKSDQCLFSFGTNNVAAVATATATSIIIPTSTTNDHDHDHDHDHELFVSTFNDDSTRPDDPFSLDDFDMDNLSIQELSGPGDYSALAGTNRVGFWGY